MTSPGQTPSGLKPFSAHPTFSPKGAEGARHSQQQEAWVPPPRIAGPGAATRRGPRTRRSREKACFEHQITALPLLPRPPLLPVAWPVSLADHVQFSGLPPPPPAASLGDKSDSPLLHFPPLPSQGGRWSFLLRILSDSTWREPSAHLRLTPTTRARPPPPHEAGLSFLTSSCLRLCQACQPSREGLAALRGLTALSPPPPEF